MRSKASSPHQYVEELPAERREAMSKLRKAINKKLPGGFHEEMSYGMIGYVVPHSLYPDGYHCDPRLPLPFMNIASQKNFIVVYHMGMYAENQLLQWFTEEFAKHTNAKLDMGKSCIRFKNPETIPFELIGELAGKMTVSDWIKIYEANYKNKDS